MILTRPGVSTPQELLEKAAVKELLEFERFCRDNGLWAEMKKCFAEDSTVNISWYQGTGYGFVDASSKMKNRAPHKIYNTEVWLNGDKAVAVMMVTIGTRMKIDGVPLEMSSDAKLIYRTKKIDGLWVIAAFDIIYEQDAITPVFPSGNFDLPSSELSGLRQSYACLTYTMKRNGLSVNNELAGIDRPDLVEKLYNEVDKWLCH